MKLTNETIKMLKEKAENLRWESGKGVIGIRVQDVPFETGAMDHNSHIWDDGDDTGEELDGVCAVSYENLQYACQYYGEHIAIIGGDHYEYGEDAGEIIIRDAEVLEIIC